MVEFVDRIRERFERQPSVTLTVSDSYFRDDLPVPVEGITDSNYGIIFEAEQSLRQAFGEKRADLEALKLKLNPEVPQDRGEFERWVLYQVSPDIQPDIAVQQELTTVQEKLKALRADKTYKKLEDLIRRGKRLNPKQKEGLDRMRSEIRILSADETRLKGDVGVSFFDRFREFFSEKGMNEQDVELITALLVQSRVGVPFIGFGAEFHEVIRNIDPNLKLNAQGVSIAYIDYDTRTKQVRFKIEAPLQKIKNGKSIGRIESDLVIDLDKRSFWKEHVQYSIEARRITSNKVQRVSNTVYTIAPTFICGRLDELAGRVSRGESILPPRRGYEVDQPLFMSLAHCKSVVGFTDTKEVYNGLIEAAGQFRLATARSETKDFEQAVWLDAVKEYTDQLSQKQWLEIGNLLRENADQRDLENFCSVFGQRVLDQVRDQPEHQVIQQAVDQWLPVERFVEKPEKHFDVAEVAQAKKAFYEQSIMTRKLSRFPFPDDFETFEKAEEFYRLLGELEDIESQIGLAQGQPLQTFRDLRYQKLQDLKAIVNYPREYLERKWNMINQVLLELPGRNALEGSIGQGEFTDLFLKERTIIKFDHSALFPGKEDSVEEVLMKISRLDDVDRRSQLLMRSFHDYQQADTQKRELHEERQRIEASKSPGFEERIKEELEKLRAGAYWLQVEQFSKMFEGQKGYVLEKVCLDRYNKNCPIFSGSSKASSVKQLLHRKPEQEGQASGMRKFFERLPLIGRLLRDRRLKSGEERKQCLQKAQMIKALFDKNIEKVNLLFRSDATSQQLKLDEGLIAYFTQVKREGIFDLLQDTWKRFLNGREIILREIKEYNEYKTQAERVDSQLNRIGDLQEHIVASLKQTVEISAELRPHLVEQI
jgi:hypothetical protein